MANLTLKLENGDIVLSGIGRLETVEDLDSIIQSYKVLLETQFGSDFRSPEYGFKLQDLLQSEYTNKIDLLTLYVKEALLQHSKTERILEVLVTRVEDRHYLVNVRVQISTDNEPIELNFESEVNV